VRFVLLYDLHFAVILFILCPVPISTNGIIKFLPVIPERTKRSVIYDKQEFAKRYLTDETGTEPKRDRDKSSKRNGVSEIPKKMHVFKQNIDK